MKKTTAASKKSSPKKVLSPKMERTLKKYHTKLDGKDVMVTVPENEPEPIDVAFLASGAEIIKVEPTDTELIGKQVAAGNKGSDRALIAKAVASGALDEIEKKLAVTVADKVPQEPLSKPRKVIKLLSYEQSVKLLKAEGAKAFTMLPKFRQLIVALSQIPTRVGGSVAKRSFTADGVVEMIQELRGGEPMLNDDIRTLRVYISQISDACTSPSVAKDKTLGPWMGTLHRVDKGLYEFADGAKDKVRAGAAQSISKSFQQ